MDAKTLKALKQSIAKWKKRASGERMFPEGPDGCPLCELFYAKECRGCPIAKATRATGCDGTPYEGWRNIRDLLGSPSDSAKRSARDMLIFLQSLLPLKKKAVR